MLNISCVTLGVLLYLYVPEFPYYKIGKIILCTSQHFLKELNEWNQVKYFKKDLNLVVVATDIPEHKRMIYL